MRLRVIGFGVLLAISLGLTACGDVLVSHFAFVPSKASDDDRPPADPRIKEHYLPSLDGTRLHAITVEHPEAERHILYLHGNAGHALHRLTDVRLLSDAAKAHVLLLDYRGYGKSDGHADEQGVYQDAEAALDWMTRHWSVKASEIAVVGRSLGSAVGVDLAVKRTPAALVLVSPLESGIAMARSMGLGLFTGLVDQPFDSIHKVQSLRIPALFIHGDQDSVVPLAQGRALFEAYAGKHKRFVEVKGGGHNDLLAYMGQRYFTLIGDFVRQSAQD